MSDESPQSEGGNKVLLIIVLVLAAVCLGCGGLVTLIFFGAKGAVQEAVAGAQHDLAASQATILKDHLDELSAAGRVPAGATADQIFALVRDDHPAGHDVVVDPWGKNYVFRKTNEGWTVFSAGPDGTNDTEDDIQWVPHKDRSDTNEGN